MKPSDFILNTDYLSLAQTAKKEFQAYFAPEPFASGQFNRTQDFTIPRTQGAIDRILISHNGGNYIVGDKLVISESPVVYVNVYRTSPTNVRVRLHVYTTSQFSMPAHTIRVKIASFQPPNVY